MSIKHYVLDTNVLLHDPKSLKCFEDNQVLIPIEVLEEVDRFKRENSELGRNARSVARMLDELRQIGSLNQGVDLENGGRLRILFEKNLEFSKLDALWDSRTADTRIVAQALAHQNQNPGIPTILVSKDINLRLKADALGLRAEDYETDRIFLKDLYSGTFSLEMSESEMSGFRKLGEMPLPDPTDRFPNEYCDIRPTDSDLKPALARVSPDGANLLRIRESHEEVWGIRPRNKEQSYALDALMDDRISLVTLMGKAGTGKTLLAIAAGLKLTSEHRDYRRVLVARPTISMGKELGFLPGSLEEKLNPWMQPIHDALELLNDLNMGQGNRRTSDLMRNGALAVEALSYIRGRSIANQFMIIDEAQNLTPIEVKTIVTRVGHGTKIVFTGDPYQIDNPYVDSSSNGFNYLISRFRDQAVSAHIELTHGERSELAELAANLL